MKKIITALAIGAGLYVGQVQADYGDSFITGVKVSDQTTDCSPGSASDVFTVVSDGQQFFPDPHGSDFIVVCAFTVLDAERFGRIEAWEVYLKTRASGGSWMLHRDEGFSFHGYALPRPRRIEDERIIYGRFSTMAAMHCNNLADSLRLNGFSDSEIFSQDRHVNIELDAGLAWWMTFGNLADDNEQPYPPASAVVDPQVQVVCKAHEPENNPHLPPYRGDQLALEQAATIEYIGLGMEYPDTADCPTDVTMSAVFMSHEQGDFTFRFESAFGQISQPIQLTMGPADEIGGQYIKAYHKVFPADIARRTSNSVNRPAGGSNVVLPGGNGQSMPDRLVIEQSHGGIEAGDSLAGDMPGSNVAYDSLRVVILSAGPGSETASDYKEYRIDCQAGGSGVPINHFESTHTLMY